MAASTGVTLSRESRSRRERAPASEPALFRVLSSDRPLALGWRHRLGEIERVVIGRARAGAAPLVRTIEDGLKTLALHVPDSWMSSVHARLDRVLGGWFVTDAGSKNGTRVNGTPVEHAPLTDGDLVELGHTFFIFRAALAIGDEVPLDGEAAPHDAQTPLLATLLPALADDFARLADVARATVTILIEGESGVGKEVAARAVHTLSGRRGPFVAVNCGALTETLVESELFGHRKGAFSGALEDRPGLVRASDAGTLFLDEIADLVPRAQGALLRVLQEREVLAVGATRPVPVDLRVVAATQRPAATLVEGGGFRADLYARLAGFQIRLPRLDERREDLGLLLGALLRRIAAERAGRVELTTAAARALLRHPWPLNVRELEQCTGAALALAGTGAIELEHLPEAVRASASAAAPSRADDADRRRRDQLVALLREHGGNISAVARATGKARLQIQRWIKRYRLDPEAFRR